MVCQQLEHAYLHMDAAEHRSACCFNYQTHGGTNPTISSPSFFALTDIIKTLNTPTSDETILLNLPLSQILDDPSVKLQPPMSMPSIPNGQLIPSVKGSHTSIWLINVDGPVSEPIHSQLPYGRVTRITTMFTYHAYFAGYGADTIPSSVLMGAKQLYDPIFRVDSTMISGISIMSNVLNAFGRTYSTAMFLGF